MSTDSAGPLRAMLASPDHYPQAIDADEMVFAPMTRDTYRRSIFLDQRIVTASPRQARVKLDAVIDHSPPAEGVCWIFHIAHCGSTLLARALDVDHGPLVLREPFALRQVAAASAQSAAAMAQFAPLRRSVLGLVSRRHPHDHATIIKANVPVNFVIDDLMRVPDSRAILLYFPLDAYLAAVLRSEGHRQWVGRITAELAAPIAALAGPLDRLDIVGRAAMLWLAQLRVFADVLVRHPATLSLDAQHFFAAPAPCLTMIAEHFGIDPGKGFPETVVNGPLFSTYSKKEGVAFDNAMRIDREAQVRSAIATEIARAHEIVAGRLAQFPLPSALPRPVGGNAPALL
ncbi:hypothetical protein [Sphingomonas sp. CCH20-B6]|uniref:hypothetical protein n=1 Tax=Sphingomonas sp. CCH20-B6 TaxID=1768769 RepID=UPI0008358FDB|nr:hypothetical protein [Sphingomonas sp. CCH20-B6]